MNVPEISKKIKYTLVVSMIFLIVVLVAMFINMRKTINESQKEFYTLAVLKNLEEIHLNTQLSENSKNDLLKTNSEINLKNYNTYTANLRRETGELLKTSMENNFEKAAVLKLLNAVNKKIINTNRVVDSYQYLDNNKAQILMYDSIENIEMLDVFLKVNSIQKSAINFLQESTERRIDTHSLIWWFIILALLFFTGVIFCYLQIKKYLITTQQLNKLLLYNSTLLKNISDAIITTDKKGIITDWNIHAEDLYGYTAAEAVGKPANEVFKVDIIKTKEEAWKGEALHYHKNGTPINVQVSKTLIKNGNNIITGSISVLRNITSRVELETKLKLLSENLQEQVNLKAAELTFFYERIADAFIALDNDWNYTYLNKAALVAQAVEEKDILGKNIWELYPLLIENSFYNEMQKAKLLQLPQICELYHAEADKWFNYHIYPAKDGISICYHDITNTKKAEIELKKAHEKLYSHINNTPLAIMEFDKDLNILQWSKRATEIFGWSEAEVINTGFKIIDTVFEEDVQLVKDILILNTTNSTKSNIVNNRNYTKSGEIIFCEWHNSVLKDEENNITGNLCLVKDVTKEKQTQIELINAEAKFRGIVEQTIVGVYIRKGNTLIYSNPRFAEIFGYKEAELSSNFDFFKLIENDSKELVNQNTERNEGSNHYQFKGIHKTGKIIYGEMYGTITNYNGEVVVIGTLIDITEKKIADEQLRISDDALKFSNESFELVAKATNDAIWDWDIEKDTLKGNESFCNLMGIAQNDEINYADFKQRVLAEDSERLIINFNEAIANNESVITEEFRFKDHNGNYKIIFDRAYILYKNNVAYRMLGAMQDITASRETTEKLKREKELSDDIINSLPSIFYLFTKQGNYLRWNKNFETVTGYSTEEIKHLRPLDLFDAKEKDLLAAKIGNVFIAGSDSVEADILNKSGDHIPYYFNGRYINYEGEDCLMGVGWDLSEKVRSQKELIESEQKFRTLVQQASDGIIITNELGDFKEVNESAARLLGYSKKELDNMNTNDIFIEDGGFKKPLKYSALENGAVVISEHLVRRKTGRLVNVEVSAKQLSDGRYQQIIRDITERTLVEDALRISEKKYRLLFNDNPLPMWISTGPNNHFLDVNSAAYLSYGYSKKAFLNMQLADLTVTEKVVEGPLSNKIDNSLNQQNIWKHKKKDGTVIMVNLIQHEIFYEGKEAVLSLANDITSKFDAEENLQKSNEALRELASHLETIREKERSHMAREIHDELGQQLTGLKMDISWLNRKINSKDEAIQEKMKDTINLIDKTVITVRRIATELRPSILDDLGLIAAMEWQSEEFEKRAEIKSIFNSNVQHVTVKADIATAVFRIFQESLTNVLKHSKATQVISFFRLNDESITLFIEDNGIGFDENEILLKKTLGLLGMKERILLINGTYEINGNVGKGTSVTITIPLH